MPGVPGTGNALPSNPLHGTDVDIAGVTGQSNGAPGVLGQSLGLVPPSGPSRPVGLAQPPSDGVRGITGGGSGHPNPARAGVWGDSDSTNGVYGSSADWNGVEGDSWSPTHSGVAGQNNAGGPGVWGSSTGNAGEFEGNVLVAGKLTVTEDSMIGGVSFLQLQQEIQKLQQTIQQLQQNSSIAQLQGQIAALAAKEQEDVNALYAAIGPK
jgi:hypothetical protein